MLMDLYSTLRPVLFRIDPETAHQLTLKALKAGLVPPQGAAVEDPALKVMLWNRVFPNPIGLAAGFDKNAEVISPMLNLGFGFVEVGTVTPKSQAGNPRPRVFRDADNNAVINRMGFPNGGSAAFKENISSFMSVRPRPVGVIGINIGMNKDQTVPAKDYVGLVRLLGPMADYLTVNISSPNTPGLRDLQEREPLTDLLNAILDERAKACGQYAPPLLVKLAPDLSPEKLGPIAEVLTTLKIDGVILTNTTLARPSHLNAGFAAEKGGLSGAPLFDKSTDMIRQFYRLTDGTLPIIGAGGVMDAHDAYAKIKAGAKLVQVYSGLVFKGPGLPRDINRGLLRLLKADGYKTINDAVGADHVKPATAEKKVALG